MMRPVLCFVRKFAEVQNLTAEACSNFDCRTIHKHADGTYPLCFIDLDWAGLAGEAVYPPFMNHTHIKWPEGVRTGVPVLAEHDISMAMRSYDLLKFEQKQQRLQKGPKLQKARAGPVKASSSVQLHTSTRIYCWPTQKPHKGRLWQRLNIVGRTRPLLKL